MKVKKPDSNESGFWMIKLLVGTAGFEFVTLNFYNLLM